jgi:predicted transcriptional regulator of viral defense system
MPSWDALYETAYAQEGHFMSAQAYAAGFSPQLVRKHVVNRNFLPVLRGVYRFRLYPSGEYEDLVAVWLWSQHAAVFSHETALSLYNLSDVLPTRIYVTLPSRRKLPPGVVAFSGEVLDKDRQWLGPIPVTTPARTVRDVIAAHGSLDIVHQAIDQGIRRGLFSIRDVGVRL